LEQNPANPHARLLSSPLAELLAAHPRDEVPRFLEDPARAVVERRAFWYTSAIWRRWTACSVTQATSRPEALQRTDVAMPEGTIKKLTDKGFGFIALPGGKDIFFHSSGLEGVQYEDLHEGQKVSFVEGRGPKGPRAEQVRPV
jgi:cold shock protein